MCVQKKIHLSQLLLTLPWQPMIVVNDDYTHRKLLFFLFVFNVD